MKAIFILALELFVSITAYSQIVSGNVFSKEENQETPLVYANVYWAGTTTGTTTNDAGYFEIKKMNNHNQLVISYTGCVSDTVVISRQEKLKVVLKKEALLDEIVVESSKGGQFISAANPIFIQTITNEGLKKLPCCNLSESFENNASVDVNFTDAVSGAKQIQMLGLAGVYSQILTENIPSIRGLAAPYGLAYVPGAWMESIQISKGTASVINGYESTTGQINIEYKKPHDDFEKLFVNIYGNQEGRLEANVNASRNVTDNLSTIILAHASRMNNRFDMNHDSFIDIPTTSQVNLSNRWLYEKGNVESKFGFNMLSESRNGGQLTFNKGSDYGTTNAYGIGIETNRIEGFGKLGFFFPNTQQTGIGSMFSVSHHKQKSFFGLRNYDGEQTSAYANVILQTIIKTDEHNVNVGASFSYDSYNELFDTLKLVREEIVPGIFGQYTFSKHDKLSVILAFRADFHNLHGLLLTPRFHAKYHLTEQLTMRVSAGKGYRSANIFAENTSILASSRRLIIEEELEMEEAWNYGANILWKHEIDNKRNISFSIDYYRTQFINQIIYDIDANVREARFYNLKGKSYSNSYQAELSLTPIPRFEITTAFRINDVMVTMHDELMHKPFSSQYKGLLTLSYSTPFKKWSFDVTNQFVGSSHLPNTSSNPVDYQMPDESKPYYILHAQITKRFKHVDIYFGGENLTNYFQKRTIIASDAPFSEYFDTSMVWGPLTGRMFFVGLRLTIK